MLVADKAFFDRLNKDPNFQKENLLGTMALYTPIEDILVVT